MDGVLQQLDLPFIPNKHANQNVFCCFFGIEMFVFMHTYICMGLLLFNCITLLFHCIGIIGQTTVVFFFFFALHPKSTAMVMARWSVHLPTLFPGQA